MVSDRGPQFSSWFWKAFCTLIGSSASLSTGFHPQSKGQSECANQDLETTLLCLTSAYPTTRSQQLVWVEYARYTLPCSATGLSHFECSVSYQTPLFPEKEEDVNKPSPQMFICIVGIPGRELSPLFSRPPLGVVDRRTANGPQLPAIVLGREHGCSLGICPSG